MKHGPGPAAIPVRLVPHEQVEHADVEAPHPARRWGTHRIDCGHRAQRHEPGRTGVPSWPSVDSQQDLMVSTASTRGNRREEDHHGADPGGDDACGNRGLRWSHHRIGRHCPDVRLRLRHRGPVGRSQDQAFRDRIRRPGRRRQAAMVEMGQQGRLRTRSFLRRPRRPVLQGLHRPVQRQGPPSTLLLPILAHKTVVMCLYFRPRKAPAVNSRCLQ